MKRNFTGWFALACCLLLSGVTSCSRSAAPKSSEEAEREQIERNRIRRITEMKVVYFAGVMQPGRVTEVKEYDRQGLLVKETDFLADGTPEYILSYTYNKDRQLSGYTAVNAAGEFLYKVTRSYNADHKLQELYFHLPGGTYKYRTVASYDKKGRLSEYAWYWTTGFKARNVYSYHGWNKISDKEYDPRGHLNYEWTYRYDTENNLLQATQVDSAGKISRRILNVYKGPNLVSQTSYIDETVQKSTGFEYGDTGLLKRKSEYNATGKIEARYTYQFERWP